MNLHELIRRLSMLEICLRDAGIDTKKSRVLVSTQFPNHDDPAEGIISYVQVLSDGGVAIVCELTREPY